MKRKFKRQKPRSGNCGSMAIYNALQCLGIKSKLKQLDLDTRCNKQYGTRIIDITRTLKKYNIKFKHIRRAKMPTILKALKRGGIVIYLYQYNKNMGHYVLFVDQFMKGKTQYLKTVNDCDFNSFDKPVQNVRARYYNKKAQRWAWSVYRRYRERLPQAWIITKN